MLVIEAIKEMPREKLEELYVLSLHREHEAIYRKNLLEDNRYYLNNKIDKAVEFCKKQKQKMYKNRNKIAVFILSKIEDLLKDSDK